MPESAQAEPSSSLSPGRRSPRKVGPSTTLLHGLDEKKPAHSGVNQFLSSIETSHEPTLEDLERHRPRRYMNPDSPEYIEQYHRLVDTLCRSFSKTQILRFARIYALQGVNTKTKKIEMAEAIIERKWGWPNLLDVEKAKRDRTEVVTEGECIIRALFPILTKLSPSFPCNTKPVILNSRTGYVLTFVLALRTNSLQMARTCYSSLGNSMFTFPWTAIHYLFALKVFAGDRRTLCKNCVL